MNTVTPIAGVILSIGFYALCMGNAQYYLSIFLNVKLAKDGLKYIQFSRVSGISISLWPSLHDNR